MQRGRGRRQDGLLDVEALHDVEHREGGHQHERDLKRAVAPPVEVVRRHEERERDRHGERVRRSHDADGLDVA